ncbi:MAG: ABC transporter permease [Acidimicrobiales bacterium]
MLGFVVRRVLLAIPVVVLATIAVFALVNVRGDPLARIRQNPSADPATIAQLTDEYHLDRPLPVRYAHWLGDFVRGDWGTSYDSGRSVKSVIGTALPNSLLLLLGAILVSVPIALAVGVWAALRHNSAVDHAITGFAYFGLAMPLFWFGIVLQLVLVVLPADAWGVRVFYVGGKHTTGQEGELLDLLRHMALPVLTLSLANIAAWSRFQRSSMLDVLSADYLRTARANGLAERRVIMKHALRNALIPFVTVTSLSVAALVGGAIVTEQVFSWPGMGTVFIQAVGASDYPVLLAWMAVVAVAVVIVNLFADLTYGFIAPRTAER